MGFVSRNSGIIKEKDSMWTHTHAHTHNTHVIITTRNSPVFIRLWQQWLPEDTDDFCLTSNSASLFPALSCFFLSIPLSHSLFLVYSSSFFLLYFLLISPFPPQKIRRQTKTWRQKERQVEEMAKLIGITVRERDKATVPCCWLRLVKPAPAITYILTPILTADSTQNYHLPSMTILQAHPQFQWSCYLKAGQRPTTTISATFSTL